MKQPEFELECQGCAELEGTAVLVGCVDEKTGNLWGLCKRCPHWSVTPSANRVPLAQSVAKRAR